MTVEPDTEPTEPPADTSRPSRTWTPQPLAMNIRGCPAWKAWVTALAKHTGARDVAALVEESLKLRAEHAGFPEPMPPRIPSGPEKT